MKQTITVLFIVFSFLFANAQKITFGLNLQSASPLGDYNFQFLGTTVPSPPGVGLGTGLEINYWFNQHISLGFSYGNMNFQTNKGSIRFLQLLSLPLSSTALSKPMALNARYSFFSGKWRPYLGIGFGYTLYSAEKKFTTPAIAQLPESNISVSWKQDGFFLTPQLGLTFAIIKTIQVHLSMQYQVALNGIDGMHNINVDAGLLGLAGILPESGEQQTKIDATNNFYLNLGLLFTLFEKEKKPELSSPRIY